MGATSREKFFWSASSNYPKPWQLTGFFRLATLGNFAETPIGAPEAGLLKLRLPTQVGNLCFSVEAPIGALEIQQLVPKEVANQAETPIGAPTLKKLCCNSLLTAYFQ